jgi:hypothetical protein
MQTKYTKKDGKYYMNLCWDNDNQWTSKEIDYSEESQIFPECVSFIDGTKYYIPIFVSKELFKEEK